MSWRPTLESVHASRWQAVLAITGGGSGAIAALLEIPGASATLLDARGPYAGAALDEWLGSPPDQAASADTALSMACAAWQRAAQLSPHEPALLGVSCSASLSSDRPKRGEHRIHVACQSVSHTALYSLTLEKGARDRRGEEAVASALVLHALARACDSKLEIAVPLVAGERIRGHVPVALLEDAQWAVQAREEHHVGKGEDRHRHAAAHGHTISRSVTFRAWGGHRAPHERWIAGRRSSSSSASIATAQFSPAASR